MSKAVTALSLSALFLSNIQPIFDKFEISVPGITRVFVGSLLYISGSLLFALRVPSQLSQGGEIYDVVHRLKILTDWKFFDSYRTMATSRNAKFNTKIDNAFPSKIRKLLNEKVSASASITNEIGWSDSTAGIYQAYLEVLNYERPWSRFLTSALILTGIITLFWPLLENVTNAICGLTIQPDIAG